MSTMLLEFTPGTENLRRERIARLGAGTAHPFTQLILSLSDAPLPRRPDGHPLTDEQIERWGDLYQRHHLYQRGLNFIVFLQLPVYFTHLFGVLEYPYLPEELEIDEWGMHQLLPKQLKIMRHLWQHW